MMKCFIIGMTFGLIPSFHTLLQDTIKAIKWEQIGLVSVTTPLELNVLHLFILDGKTHKILDLCYIVMWPLYCHDYLFNTFTCGNGSLCGPEHNTHLHLTVVSYETDSITPWNPWCHWLCLFDGFHRLAPSSIPRSESRSTMPLRGCGIVEI